MCGIAGFIDLQGSRPAAQSDQLAGKMATSIRHRGPDAEGVWSEPSTGVWLAHRRLSIVDLTDAGAQPMSTPDSRLHLVYNGEIYNAAELRPNLEHAGCLFRGHSDTEVLLHGCRTWGIEAMLRRVLGFFAFALWDSTERTLTLAADRLGKKPLYFASTPGSFLFGSELRPLMVHPDCPREIDRSSVIDLMRTHYIPAPYSIFSGVEKVAAGEVVQFHLDSRTVTRRTYWDLLDQALRGANAVWSGSPEEAVDETERLISDATRIRMVADVPLGAFLSGGIDSSTVVAMMQRHSSRPVRTFSIGYANREYDESVDARAIAQHLGTDHTELMVQPGDALAIIPTLPVMFDEPFADASQVPTYLVSRMARQHVTVALGGDGGDEMFAGYNRHVAAAGLLARLSALPEPARQGLARLMRLLPPDRWRSLMKLLPRSARPRSAGEKIHKLANLLSVSTAQQYRSLTSHWQEPREVVIGGSERQRHAEHKSLRERFPDPVSYMRYLDLATYLPGDILTKVDRASMAASLEVRAPLLDHRLVEFGFSIPSSIHLRDGRGKWLLRQVLARSVPRALFDRPKMGFGIPVGDSLRGPLREWAESLLTFERLTESGLVRPEPIRKIWQSHLTGQINAQYQLWPVLMLIAWSNQWRTSGAHRVNGAA